MIRKEAVWTLSNVCAGSETHVKEVIEMGMLDKMIQMVYSDVIEV